MIKALFLDRDGVINIDDGYVWRIDSFKFYSEIFELVRQARSAGFTPFIVTNQSGIARNYFSEQQFFQLMDYVLYVFASNDVPIQDYRFCPHLPSAGCSCRKPKPGMIFDLAETYSIDLKNSVFIGDKSTDIQCGQSAGVGLNFRLSEKSTPAHFESDVVYFKDLAALTNLVKWRRLFD